MNILAFDTSTELLSVAANTHEVSHFGPLQHAERIISLTEQALDGAHLKLEDVDAFVIGEGPGSFTGLRVGFATLQGIAVATGKPCFGIASLDVTAQAGRAHEGFIAVVMDARREKVYLGLYESVHGILKKQEDYLCVTPDEAADRLKTLSRPLWITGNGLAKYAEIFKQNLPKALLAGESFWYPHSLKLIELFHNRRSALKPIPVSQLVPLYLQDPHIGPVKTKTQH